MTAGAIRRPLPARTATPRRTRIGKRLFDVVLAGLVLVSVLPLLLLLAILVCSTSRGGAFYRQVRIGRGGRPFVMLKLRTMRAGCSDEVHRAYVRHLLTDEHPVPGGARGLYKLEKDARVTRVGRLLRRTSLDELPQLINVVRGEMSLVGPRPALPYEVELFSAAHRDRFLVPPGLTGLWQVSGRSRIPMRDGLDLDIRYVREQCFWLDLVILLRTIPAVLAAWRSS